MRPLQRNVSCGRIPSEMGTRVRHREALDLIPSGVFTREPLRSCTDCPVIRRRLLLASWLLGRWTQCPSSDSPGCRNRQHCRRVGAPRHTLGGKMEYALALLIALTPWLACGAASSAQEADLQEQTVPPPPANADRAR